MPSHFHVRSVTRFPVVTVIVLSGCTLGFVVELAVPAGTRSELVLNFGLVPTSIVAYFSKAAGATFANSLLPLLSSLFLHGGFIHFLGNAFFLWMVGDITETWLGRVRFAVLFLFGIISELIVRMGMTSEPSQIASVGIGGGVAAVMGGYVVILVRLRDPRYRESTWRGALRRLPLILGALTWFPLQLLNGWQSLVQTCQTAEPVRWSALGSSFLLGAFLLSLSGPGRRRVSAPTAPAYPPEASGAPIIAEGPGEHEI